jgi:hypothetical protein
LNVKNGTSKGEEVLHAAQQCCCYNIQMMICLRMVNVEGDLTQKLSSLYMKKQYNTSLKLKVKYFLH